MLRFCDCSVHSQSVRDSKNVLVISTIQTNGVTLFKRSVWVAQNVLMFLILQCVGAGGTRGDFNRPTAWL
jgi:hypothetical protein